jgi:dihydroorotase
MIGLESCFGAVNKILVCDEGLDLGNVLKLLTSNPRAVMGFEQDLFSQGTEAEITILDPDVEWIFEKVHVQSRSINSPYYGEIFKGKVEFTISRGLITTQLS